MSNTRRPGGLAGGSLLDLEPDRAEIRVVIETRGGVLVETLLDAGFTLLLVNPDLVACRRGPAKKTTPGTPASAV